MKRRIVLWALGALLWAGSAAAQSLQFTLDRNLFAVSQGSPVTMTVTADYAGSTSLKVYNSAGELIGDLYEGSTAADSPQTFTWNGTTAAGDPAASGSYFFRLRVGPKELVKRLALVR
jgi:flagellar hook assembly protein FlgD